MATPTVTALMRQQQQLNQLGVDLLEARESIKRVHDAVQLQLGQNRELLERLDRLEAERAAMRKQSERMLREKETLIRAIAEVALLQAKIPMREEPASVSHVRPFDLGGPEARAAAERTRQLLTPQTDFDPEDLKRAQLAVGGRH